LERDKIAEPDGLAVVQCGPAHLTVVEMRRQEPEPGSGSGSGSGNERRPGRLPRLRLHRRIYRGEASSTGARAASASANISG
jgi:hypothetical protein